MATFQGGQAIGNAGELAQHLLDRFSGVGATHAEETRGHKFLKRRIACENSKRGGRFSIARPTVGFCNATSAATGTLASRMWATARVWR